MILAPMIIGMMVGDGMTVLTLWFGQGWIGGLLAYTLGGLTAMLLSLHRFRAE